MEGEMKNLVVIWSTVVISLWYCHTIAKYIDKGTPRLICIIPIITLFFFLPLNLTTAHFIGLTSFFITWLSNFKLALFSYGKGPLSSKPPLSLSHFILMAGLPIKPIGKNNLKAQKSLLNYSLKFLFFCLLVKVYKYEVYIHRYVRLLLYTLNMYIFLELLLAVIATVTKALVGIELEEQFDEPFLSTSLQDFWGKRWNVVVCNILRPAVYDPVKSVCLLVVPRKWAPLPAVLASFFVSGVMHEVILYYMGRMRPTWHVTAYFVINGIGLVAEIFLKKVAFSKVKVSVVVSWCLTLGFVHITAILLFLPSLLKFELDLMVCREMVAFFNSVVHGRLVSPSNVSCPLSF